MAERIAKGDWFGLKELIKPTEDEMKKMDDLIENLKGKKETGMIKHL